MSALLPPPGRTTLPTYDHGWLEEDGYRRPFMTYADGVDVNWSDKLEALHEESGRSHFIDVWTRSTILAELGPLRSGAVVADLGCSTGYLLEDLRRAYPDVDLIGLDLVSAGLQKAHELVPDALLVRADVCQLPVADGSVDAVASANLLEHVPDDQRALNEIARALAPGGRAVLVVPSGPSTYDYYDLFLGHERRYARGELAAKARVAGLRVVHDSHIASLLYPAFWLVKQRNRRRFHDLRGDALERRVAADIESTHDSHVGRMLWRIEERLPLRLPFGIRSIVVAEKDGP